jgi:hypothetical protein
MTVASRWTGLATVNRVLLLIRERVIASMRRAHAQGWRFGRPRTHQVDVAHARTFLGQGLSLRATGAKRAALRSKSLSRDSIKTSAPVAPWKFPRV